MAISPDAIYRTSKTLDTWIERVCVLILTVLVLVVWLGIVSRYALPWNFTFTEELARYLMIWVALLSVSIGICRRQHVGMLVLFDRFPSRMKKCLAVSFDIIAMIFFGVIFFYSFNYVSRGFDQVTMIFGMPRGIPYMIIPIASGLACIQLLLSAIGDLFNTEPALAVKRT
ncbi:TRAP transporter small permease [Halomonas sp. H5]|uniref:TRAP transporter small permease n=1 Tax=Halomonas sp. H5 TaxID=3423910 RepID=UPI003D35C235